MSRENRLDGRHETGSARNRGDAQARKHVDPSQSNASSIDRESVEWQRAVTAAYEKSRDELERYAAGCLRKCAWSGIYLAMEPDDLVAEGLLVVLEGRLHPRFIRRLDTGVWKLDRCFRAAISTRCTVLRRREQRHRALLIGGGHVVDPAEALVNPVDANAVWQSILVKDRVQAGVAALPTMQNKAIHELALNDRPACQVAAEIGIAEKTLRNHQNRAMVALRVALAT
jgi:DNA-directed RNA polymerase specialized sigma24 family protein